MDDALQFIQFYNVRDFPYIALIDPRTGENMLNCSKVSVNSLLSQGMPPSLDCVGSVVM